MPRKNKKEYNDYMKDYMRDYRRSERELLNKAKKLFGWKSPKQKRGAKK